MRSRTRIFFCCCGIAALFAGGTLRAAEPPAAAPSAPAAPTAPAAKAGAHDFDFFVGDWKIHNRRLKNRNPGAPREWEEFEATDKARSILKGIGNMDQYFATLHGHDLEGVTLRLFNPATGEWSLYWVSSLDGVLQSPLVGHFTNGRGEFFADDVADGKPIKVRFVWSDITRDRAHWEQAISTDGGKTWDSNWIMEMTRVK
jgi:hypothetical protein